MAIEIIPRKKEEKTSFSLEKIFQIGVALAVLMVLVSGLLYFFEWRFSQETLEIDNLIRMQKTKEMASLEREIEGYYKKIKNLPFIIEERKSSLSSLDILEKSVHPLVFFPELNVDVSKNTITGLGTAKNIVAFDQQIRIFKDQESIIDVDAPEFKINEDRTIEFPLNIVFK